MKPFVTQWMLICLFIALGSGRYTVAAPEEGGADEDRVILTEEPVDEDPCSIIKRFVEPLNSPKGPQEGAFLNSDQEHAESIGPVLTPHTPVYIHSYTGQDLVRDDRNYTLENGRLFVNFELPFDRDRAPVIRMRPIDGGDHIPFLARALLSPRNGEVEEGSLEFTLRFPLIFQPDLEVRSVTANGKKMVFRVSTGSSADIFTIIIPVSKKDLETATRNGQQLLAVYIEGEIRLSSYEVLSPQHFPDLAEVRSEHSASGVAKLISGRDYIGEAERQRILLLSEEIIGTTKNSYEAIIKVNRYVSSRIRYFRNSMKRTAVQVMDEGLGDCDDFTRVMTALLRAAGIPCKAAVGHLYDFNNMGAHAWVEVGLPVKEGQLRWFVCDPTLASVSDDKDKFVQFKDRIYLYPLRLEINPLNLPVFVTADILLNWIDAGHAGPVTPQAYPSIIAGFRDDFTRSLRENIQSLSKTGLVMKKEFLYDPGSSYILLDKPPIADVTRLRNMRDPDFVLRMEQEATPTHSRLQLKLDNQERLVLELGVTDDDFDLNGVDDQRTIQLMQIVYKELRQTFFQGSDVRYCLEMVYYRDKYSDRLQKVTVRVTRYLVEQHFNKILDAMRKNMMIKPEEEELLNRSHTAARGKNLYFLQEISRATPPSLPVAVPENPAVQSEEP